MPAPSILIIEDDHDISETADKALSSKGYFVRVAPDARRGLSMALSYPPNLILLDYTLPDKDGLAVLSDIRASFELAHVPVIMISSKGYSQLVAQAIQRGVNDFLVKPFDINILVERAGKFLQNDQNE
ncbi:MAG: response regulator transcription factor [Chloroflexi bacterium]|nr:response regulator transcription factor [Chloroflexota bacterium]